MGFLDTILGTSSASRIKKLMPKLKAINALEPSMQALSDEELAAKTEEFRGRLRAGATLDDILPEAFAVVREAAVRTVGMRHFDVQILGGIVLHNGQISEMKTGEGKTLVETLPAYLNALEGKGVHIVTVNEYLVQRDAAWMGRVFTFLGLTVGTIVRGQTRNVKREQYRCDVIYSTSSELGFDYLRDNMAVYIEDTVQREPNYAIVDEVDSVLIDEARTPLIISGSGKPVSAPCRKANDFVRTLERGDDVDENASKIEAVLMQQAPKESGDYMVDVKDRRVSLTQRGMKKAEDFYGIGDLYGTEGVTDPGDEFDVAEASSKEEEYSEIKHFIMQALIAKALYERDVDYVVKDGEVIIVDESTGRLMIGRRYSDGLHQAIEAKEGVAIRNENRTVASITIQNYFRMYKKLGGMTGTAKTEEPEFQAIYDLDVIEIPTNKPNVRTDHNDVIVIKEEIKFNLIVEEILRAHQKGQPVLVGTASVEKSELLSSMLAKRKLPHNVLNATRHEREAEIIAQAGAPGAITIATNMAGRGTDILLGGNPGFLAKTKLLKSKDKRGKDFDEETIEKAIELLDVSRDTGRRLEARELYAELYAEAKTETERKRAEVLKAGGLYVIGTERHESRRIDNQLRGRAGRQGDPGESRFFISLEDSIMKRFGKVRELVERFGSYGDEVVLDMKMLSKRVESTQKNVEAYYFEVRKNVLKYDTVMNEQREIIYKQRREILEGKVITDAIENMVREGIKSRIEAHCPAHAQRGEWDVAALVRELTQLTYAKPMQAFVTQAEFEDIERQARQAADKFMLEQLPKALEARSAKLEEIRAVKDVAKRVKLENTVPTPAELTKTVQNDSMKFYAGVIVGAIQALATSKLSKLSRGELEERIERTLVAQYELLRKSYAEAGGNPDERERCILLNAIDENWSEHIDAMHQLRDGIGLRAIGHKDPYNEYRNECFDMYNQMLEQVRELTIKSLYNTRISEPKRRVTFRISDGVPGGEAKRPVTMRRAVKKVGKNDPCPCGSGKKYKYCCGRKDD
ncbi:MAG: preprotein translocase subunit SecA [Clostridia bacterium]|nr:preprotein translocase subunit SecA [Clostridia bacterium]